MPTPTRKELKDMVLYFGKKKFDGRVLKPNVFERLQDLAVVYKRDDGQFDLTDHGQIVYGHLLKGHDVPMLA